MKEKALLIAEKPSLMREIKAVYEIHKNELPYDIDFINQAGHLVELLKPNELQANAPERENRVLTLEPIEPETLGGWQYKVSDDKRELYEKIKTAIKSGNYPIIIHAGDPDQEGQLLVDLVLKRINAPKYCKKILRFWNNATTEIDILNALKNLRDNSEPFFINLSNAALLRQWTDYRFGMNGSSATRSKLKEFYPSKRVHSSAGRVKSVVFKMVADRIYEINHFVPKTTYGVKACYNLNFSGTLYNNKCSNSSESDVEESEDLENGIIYFNSEDEVNNFIKNMTSSAKIKSVETKEVITYAPAAYTLSLLQIEAADKFGYNPDETLTLLQTLYQNGHVSYPRTDCPLLSSNLEFEDLLKTAGRVPELKSFYEKIDLNKAISKVKSMKKYVNDKEMAKHGHTGLCPTTRHPNLSLLTADEYNIYSLICKRFIAMFLPPLVQNKTTIIVETLDTSGNSYAFKTNGKTLVSPGYTALTGQSFNDVNLPYIDKDTSISVERYEKNTKTTTCPKPFTTGTIIQAMENPNKFFEDESLKQTHKDMTIGQPSTRAKILKDLIEKDAYLEIKVSKKNEYLYPTKLGLLIHSIICNFEICKVEMTAKWEDLIKKVRLGEISFDEANTQMRKSAAKLFYDIIQISSYKPWDNIDFLPDAKYQNPNIVCKCPDCGGDILDIEGKKAYFCSGYKTGCKNGAFRNFVGSKLSRSDIKHLIEEQKIIKKKVSNKDGSKTWDAKIYYDFKEHKVEFYKK